MLVFLLSTIMFNIICEKRRDGPQNQTSPHSADLETTLAFTHKFAPLMTCGCFASEPSYAKFKDRERL